jgi:hypothetical protein
MMNLLFLLPVFLSALLMAAHFLHAGSLVFFFISLAVPAVLAARRWWAARLVQVLLILAALEWVRTGVGLVHVHLMREEPWLPAALILGGSAAFTALSALVFETQRLRHLFPPLARIDESVDR